jgi:hypothetical protein
VLYLPTSGDAMVHLVIAVISALGIALGIRAAGRTPKTARLTSH